MEVSSLEPGLTEVPSLEPVLTKVLAVIKQ